MSPSPLGLLIIKNVCVRDVDKSMVFYGTYNDVNTQLMLLQ